MCMDKMRLLLPPLALSLAIIATVITAKKVRCGEPPIAPLVGVRSGRLSPLAGSGDASAADRIVGGAVSRPHSTPWQVRIGASGHPRVLFCSGSLVSHQWLLTAAHCFDTLPTASVPLELLAGYFADPTEASVQACTIRRRHITLHPMGGPAVAGEHYVDVAMVDVRHCGFEWTRQVQPVCLPRPADDYARSTGGHLLVSGWGAVDPDFALTGAGAQSQHLRQVVVPIRRWAGCKRNYDELGKAALEEGNAELYRETRITEHYFCSGAAGKDSCQGDSGGPAVTLEDGRYVLAGIVHSGVRCGAKDYPGIYLNVPSVVPWIVQVINNGTAYG